MNHSYHKVVTAFKRTIEVTGHPVHYFAYVVEALAILAPFSSMFHPTHAFEYCHVALFFLNFALGEQLKRYHERHQQE